MPSETFTVRRIVAGEGVERTFPLHSPNVLDVEIVRSNQFLCHYEDFIEWVDGRKAPKMEDFYRWQRRRLGVLMDGDEPAKGHMSMCDVVNQMSKQEALALAEHFASQAPAP